LRPRFTLGSTQVHWGQHEERRHNPLRVSAQFVEAMAQVGLKNLSEDELWQLQIHQVRPGYIKQLQEAGLTDLAVDDIVQLAIHRVRPELIVEVRSLGLTHLTVDDVVQLGVHNVRPDYLRQVQALGPDRAHRRRYRAAEHSPRAPGNDAGNSRVRAG
jgi:predicted oxidoreductase